MLLPLASLLSSAIAWPATKDILAHGPAVVLFDGHDLNTKHEFPNYYLKAEFKGTFGPRAGRAPDSGILYDIQGDQITFFRWHGVIDISGIAVQPFALEECVEAMVP